MNFFENSNKDSVLTKEDEEGFDNNKFCQFCEKRINSTKVRDLCLFTCKYRGPAHTISNKNVKQKGSIFNPLCIIILVIMVVTYSSRN